MRLGLIKRLDLGVTRVHHDIYPFGLIVAVRGLASSLRMKVTPIGSCRGLYCHDRYVETVMS